MNIDSSSLRKKVAREAANLIYSGIEKEFRQAKIKAARTFGVHFLPSNLEVAFELDKITEENEGTIRRERLVRTRKEALELMKILKAYNPRLIGSVWRGTVRRQSDIDIVVYHDEPNNVLTTLKQHDVRISQSEWVSVTKRGQKKSSFHIHLESSTNEEIEITVRSAEEASSKTKCEIYGDEIVGLHICELENLLKENPTKCFVPI